MVRHSLKIQEGPDKVSCRHVYKIIWSAWNSNENSVCFNSASFTMVLLPLIILLAVTRAGCGFSRAHPSNSLTELKPSSVRGLAETSAHAHVLTDRTGVTFSRAVGSRRVIGLQGQSRVSRVTVGKALWGTPPVRVGWGVRALSLGCRVACSLCTACGQTLRHIFYLRWLTRVPSCCPTALHCREQSRIATS